MTKQLELFGTPEAPANKLEAAFWNFHADNPHIYRLFDRFTRQAIRSGRSVFSATVIFERIRWETWIETTDEEFKVSNNHRPYYARLWLRNNPQYAGFFRCHALKVPASIKLEDAA